MIDHDDAGSSRQAGALVTSRRLLTGWVMLAALLAFSLEPLTGRMVLPKYGGSAHVWNVTMMVFQGLLLAGYAYAHGPGRRLGRGHFLVLLVPVLFLPIAFGGPSAPDSPVVTLSGRLLWHVGVPFLALTTTAVMAQTWWMRSSLAAEGEPYALYAASNVGSLIALLAYPLLIEPAFGLGIQRLLWSVAYVVFVVVGAAAWVSLRPTSAAKGDAALGSVQDSVSAATGNVPEHSATADELDHAATADELEHSGSRGAYWFTLSAVPAVLLLATTNKVAFEVGSFPLVWAVPLALYLGSFVIAFRNRTRWRRASLYWPEIVSLLAIASVLLHRVAFLVGFEVLFFVLCVALHSELYRLRPVPSRLTSFYLVMAAGGWVGGMLVALVAPVVFDRYWELPLGLLAAALVLGLATRDRLGDWIGGRPRRVVLGRGAVLLLIAVAGATIAQAVQSITVLARARSFYGGYEVRRSVHNGEPYRAMVNGGTVHGLQWESDQLRTLATSYYHEGGPIDEALHLRPDGARIGIVGLGAGVNAADLEPGENLVYYEIDPLNTRIAREWFSFLEDARGDVTVREGDARLLLAREAGTIYATGARRDAGTIDPSGASRDSGADPTGASRDTGADLGYDVLLIDAFSGDGVPVHLLTTEALEVYGSRLKEGGVIVFHISNRYNDLRGVLKANALNAGLAGAWKTGRSTTPRPLDAVARAVVIADEAETIEPLLALGWQPFEDGDGIPIHRAWTDDYINTLQPLAARFLGDGKRGTND